jgi:hypothetical protein
MVPGAVEQQVAADRRKRWGLAADLRVLRTKRSRERVMASRGVEPPAGVNDAPLPSAMDRLKRRKRNASLAFLLMPLVMLGFAVAGRDVPNWLLGALVVIFASLAWVAWLTKCPRCGRLFHVSENLASNPWTQRCFRCDFRI